MKKKIIFFVLAAALSLLGATYRWPDSAHSIGLIRAQGGEARHPVSFESGRDRYVLIATARVIPPYRGDARVVLEGEPNIDYTLHASSPIVNLGFRRSYEFKNNTFYGLQPKDRIALWVVMTPPHLDPVCAMACNDGFSRYVYEGKEYCFCSDACRQAFEQESERYLDRDSVKGSYTLAFYDTQTGASVLNVPVIFRGKGEVSNAGQGHH